MDLYNDTSNDDFFISFCGRPLWNASEAWNTERPSLGWCAQRTVLTWGPCLLLWVCAPFTLHALHHASPPRPYSTPSLSSSRSSAPLPWSPLLLCKMVLSLLVLAVGAAEVLMVVVVATARGNSDSGGGGGDILPPPPPPPLLPVDLVAPLFLVVSYGIAVGGVMACRRYGQRSSGLLFTFWGVMVLCGAPRLVDTATALLHSNTPHQLAAPQITATSPHQNVGLAATFLLQYISAVLLLVLYCFADPAVYPGGSVKVKESPEEAASFLSRITHHWVTGLLWEGWRRPLTQSDLWPLPQDCRSKAVDARWRSTWLRELSCARRKALSVAPKDNNNLSGDSSDSKSAGSGGSGGTLLRVPLFRVALRTHWRHFLLGVALLFVAEMSLFLTPVLLGLLISFSKAGLSDPTWHGYLYASLLLVTSCSVTLLRQCALNEIFRISVRLRAALMTAVYRKTLSISPSARRESTAGEIVNLMSVDAVKVSEAALHFCMALVLPFVFVVAIWQLWGVLGASVLAGLLVLVGMIPVSAAVARYVKTLEVSQMQLKDKRIKLSAEIINGIKVLKLNAWEKPFAQQVEEVRKEELQVLTKSAYLHSFTIFLWFITPYLVSLASFATFVLVSRNNMLNAETVFTSIALFNLLSLPTSQVPTLLAQGIQARVSMGRLERFFASPNLDPKAVYSDTRKDSAIAIQGGAFSWGVGGDEEWALQGVEVEVGRGQLVAVVGPVAAGKSSLLAAVLGQMAKLSGEVVVNGQVAFVSQEAWLQNASLRENITWGSPWEEGRYWRVVEACALQPDLDMLPAGDLTEIGEKGINLSGGQKQRVALARAAYSRADVFLLDDPLSAVDANVGRHIFDRLLGPSGLMAGKTRVLVTHALWVLPKVDRVVVVEEGRLVEQGTCGELLETDEALAHLLLHHITKEEVEVAEEELLEEAEEVDGRMDDSGLEELCEQLEHIPGGQQLLRQISRHSTRSSQVDMTSQHSPQKPHRSPQPITTTSTNQVYRRQISSTSSTNQVYRRQISTTSSTTSSTAEVVEDRGTTELQGMRHGEGQLVQEEGAQTGRVGWRVYRFYVASMGFLFLFVPVFLFFAAQGLQAGSSFWLSYWSSTHPFTSTTNTSTTNTSTTTSTNTTSTSTSGEVEFDRVVFLAGYVGFGVSQAVFFYLSLILVRVGCLRAGKGIHQRLLDALLHLPISFFDTTPSGRMLNRLGKDINVLDAVLPMLISLNIGAFSQVVMTLVVVAAVTPLVVTVLVPAMAVYLLVLLIFITSHRQIKRIESVVSSPVYSFFGETVQGVSTIRAFRREESFTEGCQGRVDAAMQGLFSLLISSRWLGVRLECVGNLIVFAAAVFAVAGRGSVSPGIVGLSITYALNVTVILNYLVRISSDIEAHIVSVERIQEYIQEKKEAPWLVENAPPESWPQAGAVTIKGYKARYRPGLDLVLRGLTCSVKPGEKVGIVGRTGAGKSSLTLALFRIIEAEGGVIEVDGRDIATMGLHHLRRRISIIPQDPVLFSGTLRFNLDPTGTLGDAELWHALELAHLADFVRMQRHGLTMTVDEGGANLSVGQRQLVGLARALLRKAPLLVLDEATAAVDARTDHLIQATIRQEFAHCTVLTIAHRLHTILDSDRVMVLEQGRIAEFNAPSLLLAQKDSLFHSLARDAGLV